MALVSPSLLCIVLGFTEPFFDDNSRQTLHFSNHCPTHHDANRPCVAVGIDSQDDLDYSFCGENLLYVSVAVEFPSQKMLDSSNT